MNNGGDLSAYSFTVTDSTFVPPLFAQSTNANLCDSHPDGVPISTFLARALQNGRRISRPGCEWLSGYKRFFAYR